MKFGKNILSIQTNTLKKFNSFVIADDLLAIEHISCVSKLLQDNRKEVLGIITVIELNELKDRSDSFSRSINYFILKAKSNKIFNKKIVHILLCQSKIRNSNFRNWHILKN